MLLIVYIIILGAEKRMKIKDIVNRDIVTLTNCEHEPIHIPGKIQPHGFLLGLTSEWKIEYCTDNISSFVSVSHTEVLGKTLIEVFGKKSDAADSGIHK